MTASSNKNSVSCLLKVAAILTRKGLQVACMTAFSIMTDCCNCISTSMPLEMAFSARSWPVTLHRTSVTWPKAPRPSRPTSSSLSSWYSTMSVCWRRIGFTVLGTLWYEDPPRKSHEKKPPDSGWACVCACACTVAALGPPPPNIHPTQPFEFGAFAGTACSRGVAIVEESGPACISGSSPLFSVSRSCTSSMRNSKASFSPMPSHLCTFRALQASGRSPAYSSSVFQSTWEPREWKESRRRCAGPRADFACASSLSSCSSLRSWSRGPAAFAPMEVFFVGDSGSERIL
mmetsp:Transcript_79197/g.232525  ORF Transcript_79197/g.232525 Transcript_79197/m.232525 type:complete len:289 (-) Transcript_79197:645-1511(-)